MRRRHRPQISLLVPFRADREDESRAIVWRWLRRYWEHELPDAEIVIGESHTRVFSKTDAVNDAARKARGRIFVILDADTYIPGRVIQHCADEIDRALERGHRRWFIPYRHLYRLTEDATFDVLMSEPGNPLRFSTPPPKDDVESTLGSAHGRRFGALIQIMPREAFELVGCMDPRFRGWGGEDISFVRALDTLYGKHKTVRGDVLHLWHHRIGVDYVTRMWEGQDGSRANERLAMRYNRATGDRAAMRSLVDEGCGCEPEPWWRRFLRWLWVYLPEHFG